MKKIYKKLIILLIAAYAIFTIINQQKTLNQYSEQTDTLTQEIADETQTKEELAKQKSKNEITEFTIKNLNTKICKILN